MVELHEIQKDGQRILVCFDPKPVELSKREHEQLCIRKMLVSLGENPDDLAREASGKPFLKGSAHKLSYSHSGPYFALILSSHDCGIDIQQYGKSLEKGRTYFCNKEEDCFTDEKDLYLIWSTKEALFKLFGGAFENAKNEITVFGINRQKGNTLSKISHCTYHSEFLESEVYCLVYTK